MMWKDIVWDKRDDSQVLRRNDGTFWKLRRMGRANEYDFIRWNPGKDDVWVDDDYREQYIPRDPHFNIQLFEAAVLLSEFEPVTEEVT